MSSYSESDFFFAFQRHDAYKTSSYWSSTHQKVPSYSIFSYHSHSYAKLHMPKFSNFPFSQLRSGDCCISCNCGTLQNVQLYRVFYLFMTTRMPRFTFKTPSSPVLLRPFKLSILKKYEILV